MTQNEAHKIMHQGYNLIKQGRKDEATNLLMDLVDEFQENAALWWLLANAMIGRSDDDALIALENCQALQPDHDPSRQLLEKLRAKQGGGEMDFFNSDLDAL